MQKFLKENEFCSKPFCDNEFHLNENEKWFLFQWLRTESRFETEAWATRNWPIGPSSFSCSLSFFHLRLTDIAGRGETVLEKGRACKHLFDQLSPPPPPPLPLPLPGKAFLESKLSNVQCMRVSHICCVCLTLYARSQVLTYAVKMTDHASWGTSD